MQNSYSAHGFLVNMFIEFDLFADMYDISRKFFRNFKIKP